MDAMERYETWLNFDELTTQDKEELKSLTTEEIEDRFYTELSFGTAGLRGKLGLGTNRMNEFVVARATQGLAETIKKYGPDAMKRGVAIAWDVRIKSATFKNIAARILAQNGIVAYVFDDIRPTPMLSFAVRYLNTIAGIVITASHNPQEYNGYKVYWEEGSQIRDEIADKISNEIEQLPYTGIELMNWEEGINKGLIKLIDRKVDEAFYQKTLSMAIRNDIDKNIKVVYSPLNGTGNIPVRHVLKERGFNHIYVVPEQESPDGTFKTVGYPNPEDINAFEYALEDAKELDADLIMATDPDSDRVAIMGRTAKGKYYAFNGNQTGALLIYYILSSLAEIDKIPNKAAIVKSIVTGELGTKIAKDYGVNMFSQLTGFKNICSLPNKWDKTHEYQFIFGYEESIGFLYGDHVRDKDAVVTSMMLVEMAAYYKSIGKTLKEVLYEIYNKYGFHKERLISIILEGQEGSEKIKRIMDEIRDNPIENIKNLKVDKVVDYIDGVEGIGSSNVLEYHLEDGSRFSIRPSGTEPKIKLYIYTEDELEEAADSKLNWIETDVREIMRQVE